MPELKEIHPLLVQGYEVQKKNQDLKMKHYQEMLGLYESDYDESKTSTTLPTCHPRTNPPDRRRSDGNRPRPPSPFESKSTNISR